MLDLYLKDFEKLNDYQKEAVRIKDKHILLNAVVGSGKTTVLIHKVLYLYFVEKVPLEDMVVLTFTNKAANEIRDRIKAFDEGLGDGMKYFGTFHSVARNILVNSERLEELGYKKDFRVIDNSEASEMLVSIMEERKFSIKYKAKLMKRIEDFKKGKMLYGIMKSKDDIDELYETYKNEKLQKNLMDFDDLIDRGIEIMDTPMNPSWIIIDEFQDTDSRQLELIRKMAGPDTHLFAIGDPNQIIYSWRTGSSSIFSEFKKYFSAREISLPINYRSSRTIIEAAKSFLNGGNIEGVMGYGNPIVLRKHFDSFNEAIHLARRIREIHDEGILYKNIGILFRRQAQAEVLVDVLNKNEIPCRVVFKKPLPFEEGEENIQEEEGVSLLTLHASKGLEFTHVFIIGANMGNIPLTSKRGEEEEEARLFFVGMTRAKNYLEISYLTKPGLQGITPYPSPYLSMLPGNLVAKEGEGGNNTLAQLMEALRQEREKKREDVKVRTARHAKYGAGKIIYEDDNTIKVEFDGYGEKEFSKMFCPLVID